MAWSLYKNNEFLEPLKFSNGKSQEEIVKEVLKLFEKGKKIIFIHGVCGTGKSAIALNLAKEIGQTSIVVPGKSLQAQYEKDYGSDEKYVLKKNKEKLKINIMTGRINHTCKFLEDSQNFIPDIKKEINSKLHDIFAGKREEVKRFIGKDISANNSLIPCKVEIKEKNWKKIREFLKQNKRTDLKNFNDIKDVKRFSIAPACPYWSPVIAKKYPLKIFPKAKQREYLGLENENFIFYQNKRGCPFYEQFNYYLDSDVIVFNSLKYKLESSMNRKPATEVEIIDECDEFLDSFANQSTINLDRLQNSLLFLFPESEEGQNFVTNTARILKGIKSNREFQESIYKKEILELKRTGIYDLLQEILDSQEIIETFDSENYVQEVLSSARMFDEYFNETYVLTNKKDNNILVSLVTTNLAKRFKELVEKNKKIVLMSGTLHSPEILRNIFGIDNFEVIEAETEQQGAIEIKRTGLEKDCKYSNFSSGKHSREEYLKALEESVKQAEKPVLIHINSFRDLPSKDEKKEFHLKELICRDELKEIQKKDKTGKVVRKFKDGEIDVLFSTKCSRGVDFPGKECRSIVFTKYPNPNVADPFWKILAKTNPLRYWAFYKDKAWRELLQKIYRGLRFKEDHVFLLSPDSRVLDAFDIKTGLHSSVSRAPVS